MKIVFIDGYNVLNSWPNLKEGRNDSFDGRRQKLINILHNYGVYSGSKVILVLYFLYLLASKVNILNIRKHLLM